MWEQTNLRYNQVSVIQGDSFHSHKNFIVAWLRYLNGLLKFKTIEAILGAVDDPLTRGARDGHHKRSVKHGYQ